MNKIVIGLLVAVCLLGFALILLNERMSPDVPSPVVSENSQPRAPQENIPMPAEQPSQEKSGGLDGASDNGRREVPVIAPEVQDVIPVTTVQPEIVNKALDQVLSERAVEVQAPNQQASIVQQTSVKDLVVESSQLPKIVADMPSVSEPQVGGISTPLTSSDIKDSAAQQVVSVATPVKVEDAKNEGGEKSENAKTLATPRKNEATTKEVVKSAVDDKKENGKVPATTKAKALSVTLFTVFTRENGATVRLRTNAPLPYTSAQLQNPKSIVKELQKPDRLMFDLTGAWEIKEPAVPSNIVVNKVRVGKMADRARIVVDLKDKPKKMRVKIADKKDGLDIFLDR